MAKIIPGWEAPTPFLAAEPLAAGAELSGSTAASTAASAAMTAAERNASNRHAGVMGMSVAASAGQQCERHDVLGADDAEVAPVQRGDLGGAAPFC
jgi:hypothetical protein